jgi:hypothetical protein
LAQFLSIESPGDFESDRASQSVFAENDRTRYDGA